MRSLKRKSPKVQPPSKTPTFNPKTPKSKENSAFFEAQKIQRKEEAPKEEMKDEKAQKKEEEMKDDKAQKKEEEMKDDKAQKKEEEMKDDKVQKMEKDDQKTEKETDI